MSRLSEFEMRIILIQLIFGALVFLSLSVVLMKDPSIFCCFISFPWPTSAVVLQLKSWMIHHLHLENTNFHQSSARLLKPACKRMQMRGKQQSR
ncbi:hypothetical protein DVH24_037277 [Malus domestica]|uniref:Uncharacterized protein n=1 Tax=Malus domestica TaxID=3750 RepID=A0A498HKM4_MALDO|nr:hypothetical protein DVH24_037277 [Malus domestica]